jgi:hypothetical protein
MRRDAPEALVHVHFEFGHVGTLLSGHQFDLGQAPA